jgi:hypothetical protein
MARGMLDHLLHNRKARRAFGKRVLSIDTEVPAFRTSSRQGSEVLDLVAQSAEGAALSGSLALKLIVDGSLEQERVRGWLATLGDDPSSRLVLVLPRSRKDELGVIDARLVLVTWTQIGKRMVEKDPDRGESWRALSEFGEMDAIDDVRQPVSPKILLDEEVTTEFRAHLATMSLICSTLIERAPRFSSSRSHPRAWLHAGGSSADLGVEFDAVEDGSSIWLVGNRPQRVVPLGIGALVDEESRASALARLERIREVPDFRHAPAADVEAATAVATEGFIGVPASRTLEDARTLLWSVLDPALLENAGFPLVPRTQVDLTEDRLAVRVHAPSIPRSGTFLVSVGGSRTWRTLLPRVTREFDGRTYIVQAKRGDSAQDLVTAVHEALHSLATKP